ncbi:MAG: acyl-CoA/acyl-ACP dehydrogenase [Verrucomicrobia bacterium]|nr:acyl-CoA/acyl-ACP dehydrogenase [Verrucomicrobiota bacterium]
MTLNRRAQDELRTLPGDDVRFIMWDVADRFDLQMVVQSARSVARGPVARLVAAGARNSHEWNSEKASLLTAFDEAGITSVFMEPEYGGYLEGPKNLALALVAFELSWVDAGAATCSLAGNLGLSPIHERGTEEQRSKYMRAAVPPQPGEDCEVLRGAFALTEPLPFVGVETGILSGKVKVAEWDDGGEPLLEVDKRGRFITNMAFADFVTAAVDSDDERVKGSCMIILEKDDPGEFNTGAPTKKLVHQLSATSDPVFRLKVPASRIIGGYTVKDGVIAPNYNHGEVIEAVFKRTRVTVGLMTAAKLLSSIEPLIRYHRSRFRGGESTQPGSPRYEVGLQQREDVVQRLIDIWAAGEASASLGFETARLFDELDPMEKVKDRIFAEQNIQGMRAKLRALAKLQKEAAEFIELDARPSDERDNARHSELKENQLVQYILLDTQANVLCPATKLWNTGYGANMMREALSLMGGYGITEDCPGFLAQKWMDAQLEATYEGPEAVQRRQLSVTMINELFLAQFEQWIRDLKKIASRRPDTGACTLAKAMETWHWTLRHLQNAKDPEGKKLYHGTRQGVTFPLADALCWLLASRSQILDVLRLEEKGNENPVVAEGLDGLLDFLCDLCHVQTAKAAGEVGRVCAELVYGYSRHPAWDDEHGCLSAGEADAMEGVIPGSAAAADDVLNADGSSPEKAGPCAGDPSTTEFARLRVRLDCCLAGSRLAKERAATALTHVMIPEALDYPV